MIKFCFSDRAKSARYPPEFPGKKQGFGSRGWRHRCRAGIAVECRDYSIRRWKACCQQSQAQLASTVPVAPDSSCPPTRPLGCGTVCLYPTHGTAAPPSPPQPSPLPEFRSFCPSSTRHSASSSPWLQGFILSIEIKSTWNKIAIFCYKMMTFWKT